MHRVAPYDPPPGHQAADLAVWPGASSLSFYDAQACGLPVIAEHISTNVERIRPELGNGALYDSVDGDALRRELERFYGMGREELRAMGRRGMEIVLERYDYDKVASCVEELMADTREAWLARRGR